MKATIAFIVIFFYTSLLFAQRNNDRAIQDSIIGWWSDNRYDHLKPPTDATTKKKEAILNDMIKWVKASYMPVGGLGTSPRYMGSKGYGVKFLVWNVSHDKQWTEANGSFKPIAEENTRFDLAVNQLYGAYPVDFINTGDDFYFTMEPDGYAANPQSLELRINADPRIHSNAYRYITYMNDWCVVYLAPDNQLPWKVVTKGQLLQQAEEGLQKVLGDKTKAVVAQWSDVKTQNEAIEQFKTQTIDKYKTNIQRLKEKYSRSLNEPAIIRSMQATMYSFQTDPDIFTIDPFEKKLGQAYPVYKLDASTRSKMNESAPQWVAVAFPFATKERGNQLYEMFAAMSQNINYDYIYNYFYAPEKIKGIPYTAANAAQLKARLNAYNSSAAKNHASR